jgi:hypothetical protein
MPCCATRKDTEVLASAADVPVANWLLVASLPTSEAFAVVYNLAHGPSRPWRCWQP